jgi:hypothetical protein
LEYHNKNSNIATMMAHLNNVNDANEGNVIITKATPAQ